MPSIEETIFKVAELERRIEKLEKKVSEFEGKVKRAVKGALEEVAKEHYKASKDGSQLGLV